MADRVDPYFGFRFRIVIQGVIEGGFTELSGLQATTQVEPFVEGGLNSFTRKLPKETTFENLVLKKGLADANVLWQWHRKVILNDFKRANIQIVLLKGNSEETAHQWNFSDAYPVKWTGPEFKADGNTVAFETVELAHHGYTDT